ncbi:MAG TPA: hypothetical protein VGU64_00875 [Terriglobales bacterium]|nr:hypothetical protein [Terriglobales bacterium]
MLLLLILAFAAPGFAQNGNGAPNGAHYNLNIIGVENPKTDPMTGSDRHTIFVALGKKDSSVTSKIYLTQGDFQVCDGNAFDAAYDCSGNQIQSQGAVFQLPCNTNVPADITCAVGTTSASYQVWGRALGKPGGSVVITTCATDTTTLTPEVVCSMESTLDSFTRKSGKQTFTNVTNELTSIVVSFDGGLTYQRVALFSGALQDFFWQYANSGLRLLQLRFYLI